MTSKDHMKLFENILNIDQSHVHTMAQIFLKHTAPHFEKNAQESSKYLDNAMATANKLNEHPNLLVHSPEMGPFV